MTAAKVALAVSPTGDRRQPTEMEFDPYRYELEHPAPEVIFEFNPFDDPPHD